VSTPSGVSLAFPTFEFSRCKRIPPAGCRFAGASGVEPDPRWFWRPDGCPWPRPIGLFSCLNKKPPARASVLGAVSACSLRVGLHFRHRSTCRAQHWLARGGVVLPALNAG